MLIIDQDGKAKTKWNDFVATDLPNYEVILGKPWLRSQNPAVDWESNTWAYRKGPFGGISETIREDRLPSRPHIYCPIYDGMR